MTFDDAREMIIGGIDYVAYRESGFSLHDSDKNRIFGSEHYKSGRPVYDPSHWADGDFEARMAILLAWASVMNRSDPAFAEAQTLLKNEDSVIGRIIRKAKNPLDESPQAKPSR
jgi:hypothetical protein